jgi:hypothetical protein
MLLRPAYLSQTLDRPLPTKDGGTLRTAAEARAYMLGLSKARELRSQWQHAAKLLLREADIGAFSTALELALFLRCQAGRVEDHRQNDRSKQLICAARGWSDAYSGAIGRTRSGV